MIDFDFNEYCCGCTACYNVCPVQAISMCPSQEGFLIPVVDKTKCIDCSKCDKVCSYLNLKKDTGTFSLDNLSDKNAYLYYSNNKKRVNSASGGFVYDLYENIVSTGGLACGCVWDKNLQAHHIVSDKQEDLIRMQSSKYVQSNLESSYKSIKDSLKSGKEVVFCGTPCQTAGLRMYVGENLSHGLTSVCLICHGVPSPLVWEKYKSALEQKYKAKLSYVNMRDKSFKGYSVSYVKYVFTQFFYNDKKERFSKEHIVAMPTYLGDPYIFLFTDNLFLRNSCHHCIYKADNNGADLIVGDFYASTEGADNLGCSCVIAMTKKGDTIIDKLDGVLKKSDIQTVGSVNSMLWKSVKPHINRTVFFSRMQDSDCIDFACFKSFLPLRFKVKKILNNIGVFQLLKKTLFN